AQFGDPREIDLGGEGGVGGEISEGRAAVVGCHGARPPSARLVAASRLSRSPSITRTGASCGGWETRPHLSGSEREPFPFFRVGAWSSRAFSGSVDSGPSAFSSSEVRVVGGVSVGRSSSPLPGSNLPPLACSTFSGAPRKVSPK